MLREFLLTSFLLVKLVISVCRVLLSFQWPQLFCYSYKLSWLSRQYFKVSGLLSVSLFKSIVVDYCWYSHTLAGLQVGFLKSWSELVRLPDRFHVIILARLQEKCILFVVSVSLKNEGQFLYLKKCRLEQKGFSRAKGKGVCFVPARSC